MQTIENSMVSGNWWGKDPNDCPAEQNFYEETQEVIDEIDQTPVMQAVLEAGGFESVVDLADFIRAEGPEDLRGLLKDLKEAE